MSGCVIMDNAFQLPNYVMATLIVPKIVPTNASVIVSKNNKRQFHSSFVKTFKISASQITLLHTIYIVTSVKFEILITLDFYILCTLIHLLTAHLSKSKHVAFPIINKGKCATRMFILSNIIRFSKRVPFSFRYRI